MSNPRIKIVLRHVASGLYCPNALNGPLVTADKAYRFKSQKAAAQFLRDNPEFTGFRIASVVRISSGEWV